MGFRNSYVGNLSLFYEIEEKLKQGHNVVLISNHHTEADPIIISLLLEKANPHIAENMLSGWYIAWLLLKMEHYFIGFPQILILDANWFYSIVFVDFNFPWSEAFIYFIWMNLYSYIPFVRKQS
ncbi:hypothetical protein ES319_D08G151900v1 [Gossypium barbadense]|uniref:Phospholipid/glycerol acyltransferase domain-containing protein n=2 Tax=Gossypium TaxID=3633 RepID=A0A5J5QEY0_GOSBA|nr:hypothetical protein ES319_D08G151900v1 [Gossypium barbadense]TYG57674.1 hypothetical protein ES288_D08G161600v1 [Gossypium darwinii]